MTVEKFDVGDKIEITHRPTDSVRQGWVAKYSDSIVTIAGMPRYFIDPDVDEVRVLVKKPKPLAVGDEVYAPAADDLPIGMVIIRGKTPWIVLPKRDNKGEIYHLFVSMTDCTRIHRYFLDKYTIAHLFDLEK